MTGDKAIARGAAMGEAFAGLGRTIPVACAPTLHARGQCAGCSDPPTGYLVGQVPEGGAGSEPTAVGSVSPEGGITAASSASPSGRTIPGEAGSAQPPASPGQVPEGPVSAAPGSSGPLDPAALIARSIVTAIEMGSSRELPGGIRHMLGEHLADDIRTALRSYR